MNKPVDQSETLKLHNLSRSNPKRYIRIMSRRIEQDPKDSNAYFGRHFGWLRINEPSRALEDLDKVIELEPDQTAFLSRGRVHRQLGQYRKALADFDRGEKLHPWQWEKDATGLLYQADCHARLGDAARALAYCGRLPDDFWTPGLRGAPPGSKVEIAKELRLIAAAARRKRTHG